MPSNKNPLTTTTPGAGKLHADIATASAQLFASGGGNAAMIAFLNAVSQQELAVIRKTAGVVDTGQASYNIRLSGETDPIWVSDAPGTDLSDLFIVVFEVEDVPVKVVGSPVVTVASLTGAAVGDGFTAADPLTLNFSSALPTSGLTFSIYYAARQQVASFTPDALSYPNIRQAMSVHPEVLQLLEDLHATTAQTWDDPWDATIEALAASGLNERYRRQTTVPGSFTYDTPGDGAAITRDGHAPESVSTQAPVDYTNNPLVDPYLAQWKTSISGADVGTFLSLREGGTGFVSVGSMRYTSDVNELAKMALSAGSNLTAHPRNIIASTLNAASVRTQIDPTLGCILNPDAGGTPSDRARLVLTGGNYFFNGSSNTEIAVGYDLIRVIYTSSRPDEIYVIHDLISSTRVELRTLSGNLPNFPSGVQTTNNQCQLIKTVFHMGGGAARRLTNNIQLGTSLYHAVPPSLTDDPATATEVAPNPARFLAAARTASEYSHTGAAVPLALQWGGFDPTLTAPQSFPGKLRGDGGIDATIASSKTRTVTISATGTTTWHPGLEGSILHVEFTHASGTITWTLAMHADYDPVLGERLEIIILPPNNAPPTGTAEITINWPAAPPNNFISEVLTQTDEIVINNLVWYRLTHFALAGTPFGWLMQRNNRHITVGQRVPIIEQWDLGTITGGGVLTWRPMSEGGFLSLDLNDALAYTLSVTGETGGRFPRAGLQIAIEVLMGAGGATMTWPANFLFSGADGTLPPNAGDRVLYRGIYSTAPNKWLMTRTDY